MKKIAALTCVLALAAVSNAAIVAVEHGIGTPPATLGSFAISALPVDGTGTFTDVTSAPGNPPLTGDVGFSTSMNVRRIASGWATWSHGYTGVVYYTNGATSMTMSLPADTGAFLAYVEPNPFTWQTFTATADDGTSVSFSAHGSSGANGFGFYGTGGTTITSIAVTGSTDFAIGEFYGAVVPEPGSLALLGLGGLALIRRR